MVGQVTQNRINVWGSKNSLQMTIYMYHLENNQQLLNHSQALQKFIEHHEPGKAFSLSILDAIETE